MPRIRDFRGLSTRSFDGRGNYSLGVKEQMIFPEINYDMVEQIHGMDITFVTTTNRDDQALRAAARAGHAVPGRDAGAGRRGIEGRVNGEDLLDRAGQAYDGAGSADPTS